MISCIITGLDFTIIIFLLYIFFPFGQFQLSIFIDLIKLGLLFDIKAHFHKWSQNWNFAKKCYLPMSDSIVNISNVKLIRIWHTMYVELNCCFNNWISVCHSSINWCFHYPNRLKNFFCQIKEWCKMNSKWTEYCKCTNFCFFSSGQEEAKNSASKIWTWHHLALIIFFWNRKD